MHFRRLYWRISLGGLGLLIVMMALVAALGGGPLELLYFTYFWIMLWIFIGLLALGFVAVRRALRVCKPGRPGLRTPHALLAASSAVAVTSPRRDP